jgi:hypothetical protein
VLRQTWSNHRSARGLNHIKEIQYDEYDGDNDEKMDPTAGFRDSWTDVRTKKAEQPQDYENYDDRPHFEISPFEWSDELLDAPRSFDRAAVDLTVLSIHPVRFLLYINVSSG